MRAARRNAPSDGGTGGACMRAFFGGRKNRFLRYINNMHEAGIYRRPMNSASPGKTWLLIAPGLALVVLTAHFYRAAAWPLVAASLLALVLLALLRRRWVRALLQACLLAGATEWLWTAFMLVQQRTALGLPWLRLVLILGTVALLTAAAAAVFLNPSLRARYAPG